MDNKAMAGTINIRSFLLIETSHTGVVLGENGKWRLTKKHKALAMLALLDDLPPLAHAERNALAQTLFSPEAGRHATQAHYSNFPKGVGAATLARIGPSTEMFLGLPALRIFAHSVGAYASSHLAAPNLQIHEKIANQALAHFAGSLMALPSTICSTRSAFGLSPAGEDKTDILLEQLRPQAEKWLIEDATPNAFGHDPKHGLRI